MTSSLRARDVVNVRNHFCKVDIRADFVDEIERIKTLEIVRHEETPTNQLLFVLDVAATLSKETKTGQNASFEMFALKCAKGDSYCWIIFDRNEVFKKINIHAFVLDRSAPIFLQAFAIRELEYFFEQYVLVNREYCFTAFLTERTFRLYKKINRKLFETIVMLPKFYRTENGSFDGYFGYRAPENSAD